MREHEQRRATEADGVHRGDAEEDVAHVHHARIAEQEVEFLLRDGGKADVDDVPDEQNEEQVGPVFRALGQQRKGNAHQAVEPELFQHTGVEHRRRRGRGGVGRRCPGVEWEEGNQDAEPDEQKDIRTDLRSGGDGSAGREFLEVDEVESAQRFRHGEVEIEQADEQDEAAEPEIDRNFPRRRVPLAAAPNTDEQEGRDEREFVEGVEEEEIDRGKRARGSGGDEEQARVVERLTLFDLRRDPDRGERDDAGEQQHEHAEAVHADEVVQVPFRRDGRGGEKLKASLRFVVGQEREKREQELRGRRPERGLARRRAEQDAERGEQWDEDDEAKHGPEN